MVRVSKEWTNLGGGVVASDVRTASVLAALTLLGTACGDGVTVLTNDAGTTVGTASTGDVVEDTTTSPTESSEQPAEESSSSEPGILIDGVFHGFSCHGVIDEMVSEFVVTTGDAGTNNAEIRTIVDVDSSVLLAARGLCDGDNDVWTAVFPPRPDRNSPHDVLRSHAIGRLSAICTALVGAGDRCDQGVTADWWYVSESGRTVWNYEHFESFVEQIENAPPDHPERLWRSDVVETIKRTAASGYAPGTACDGGSLTSCRVTIAKPTQGDALVVVEGVIHAEHERFSEIVPFTVTIERLIPTGQTWWVTSYTEEAPDPNADTDCCPVVISESTPAP